MRTLTTATIGALGLACFGQSASAIVILGTSGSRAASAEFSTSGSDLIVRLTNTAGADALAPVDILTGVFFNISGPVVSLTRTSAAVTAGSVVHFGATDPGNVVGGEWAYRSGLAGAPFAAAYGISSAGLGLFGPGDVFPGTNLAGPADPDGLQYGITTAGDNTATGNGAVTGGNALTQNAVVFTLSGLPANFDLGRIGTVSFQYGTALDEPNVPSENIPAPAAGALLALGVVGASRRRRH